MADRKAVIKNADMSEDMQQDAVDCASQALEKYNIEKVGVNLKLVDYFSFYKTQHTFIFRILQLILKRNSIKNIILLGTV